MRKRIDTYIIDGCTIEVEIMTTIKDIFDYIEQYIYNLQYDWFDATDESFQILYKDGTEDYIDNFYDGHKIYKRNIKSIVYNNPCTYMIYGNYTMNEYGIAYCS